MDDKRRTLVAYGIIILVLVLVVAGSMKLISGRNIVSPVPQDEAIKIIFITPTPESQASPSAMPTGGATSPAPSIKKS